MRLFIDADACPVREEAYRVAARMGLEVLVVHNGSRPIRPPQQPGVQMIIVADGPDAADDWIAERIEPGDICITADIPLAKRCLERGARALGHTGRSWTGDNIGSALAGREIARHMREVGLGGGAHAPLTQADRSRFSSALDAEVIRARRDVVRPVPSAGRP
ncbi:YaiI/YqxD family protein [Acidisphaera sp. L21]|uniref:YaiI/YqxD family protein n=1 Tax=Acidisphaera sp. L21 TaxID=1641851 RepID=UPI00131B407B